MNKNLKFLLNLGNCYPLKMVKRPQNGHNVSKLIDSSKISHLKTKYITTVYLNLQNMYKNTKKWQKITKNVEF